MIRRGLQCLSALLIVAACGSPPPPPRKAPPPAAPVKVEDEPKGDIPANIYVYSPIGKRDPFQNTAAVSRSGIGRADTRGRNKTPLEKWPLDMLKLTLTMTGTASPMAMVEDPEKRGWPVRLGDFVGQNGGKVTGIHRDEVVVTETITDNSTGRVYPVNVKLVVPVDKTEESDLRALQDGENLGVAKGSK